MNVGSGSDSGGSGCSQLLVPTSDLGADGEVGVEHVLSATAAAPVTESGRCQQRATVARQEVLYLSEVLQSALLLLVHPGRNVVEAGQLLCGVGGGHSPGRSASPAPQGPPSSGDPRRPSVPGRCASDESRTVVLLEVAVEVGLLAEAAVAQRAAERALAVVDVADVALEVGRDAKAAPAVLAPVGLFSGMCAQVAGQVSRARKRLAAVTARVPVRLAHRAGSRNHSRSS